jgi:hypothetical protein
MARQLGWLASWAVVRSPLAAARATLALKAAPKTRRFPLIVMLRKGCLPPSELHLIGGPEKRGPPHPWHPFWELVNRSVTSSASRGLAPSFAVFRSVWNSLRGGHLEGITKVALSAGRRSVNPGSL